MLTQKDITRVSWAFWEACCIRISNVDQEAKVALSFTPLHCIDLLSLCCSSCSLTASAVAESCRHASSYEEGAIEEPNEEQR